MPEGGIVGKKSRDNIQKTKNKKRAKTYVEHVYPPNGVGPDTDLILLLEREVVKRDSKVAFEDIAELDDAKRVLQEAVLLPLLMPEFF